MRAQSELGAELSVSRLGLLAARWLMARSEVDGRSEPPSKVMMTALAEATAITMNVAAAAAASVRGLPTGGRSPADVVASLPTAAWRAGETAIAGATATTGATTAGGCTSETNPESESMPVAVLPVLLAGSGPERTRKESGRRVKGIFAPASVELETDPTFTPTSHGVKSI